MSLSNEESEQRTRLGIPQEAEKVLIFGETSHWDPNWLHTSEEYYQKRIQHILDAAVLELSQQPRRVFSLESLFFFQMYWRRRPEQRRVLRQLVNEGRLRLTGTGITTPDSVLPSTEALIRDYLHGQQWLYEQGMTPEPTLAYLPDDFGISPALPSILRSLGFESAGITRIDGMHFIGCDYRPKSAYPLPGSSAALLEKEHQTADFIWRAPDGAEVLCHWNAFTYFQGDMLACMGVIRWMGTTYGVGCRRAAHIARRVRSYVNQLSPLAKTPYLFCPIGCDFNDPIPDLVHLLDTYNEKYYPRTGVWAVNAGLDDYIQFVQRYRDLLPTLEIDANPYWMGFYASRPQAKVRVSRITRKLVLAEKLSALATLRPVVRRSSTCPIEPDLKKELQSAWDHVVLSNHHDFITGTSPDRIWRQEQLPGLVEAEELADAALRRIRSISPIVSLGPPLGKSPRWERQGHQIHITTRYYQLTLDEQLGGCIVSCKGASDGRELLSAPANDLVVYRDSGGLWRMGHEFAGGVFRELRRASQGPATIQVLDRSARLEVRIDCELAGQRYTRWMWIRDEWPIIRMRLLGAAGRRRTVTCRFPTAFRSDHLTMNVPGGVIKRPRQKLYEPTFWPLRSFVHLKDDDSDWGLAAFLGGPATASLGPSGQLEWMAFRFAPSERAWGVLPIPAHPCSGTAPDEAGFDYAVWFTPRGDYRENRLPQCVRRALRAAMFSPGTPDIDAVANSVVLTDHDDVIVSTLKVASRGRGLIARLRSLEPDGTVRLRCPRQPIRTATLCDARERDLSPLDIQGGQAVVPIQGAITSIRLQLSDW